ncbi:MAG: oligopeptide/dipeptide ABC transporter ATP-binding protein [Verrucomicrobiota bacterium]
MSHLLKVENLKMHFPVKGGVLLRSIGSCKAVNGVSFHIDQGETLGLVGESGCGKSTLGKCIVRLLNPTDGRIEFDGKDITHAPRRDLLPLRKDMQMIFQDPAESLNSRHTVGSILEEPFVIHGIGSRAERREKAIALLEKVGMSASAMEKYSFEFSGGQRQRIGIARSIALNPRLVVCDEPVSALDVSVQSQVLNLMMELQRELALSYLFIAHDLAVVRHVSDRVAIMYLGEIVEIADADTIYSDPRHAYTKALISAIPIPDPSVERPMDYLEGDVPSPIHPPKGCAFAHRVSHPKWEQSIGKDLRLKEVEPGHWVQNCPCCVD